MKILVESLKTRRNMAYMIATAVIVGLALVSCGGGGGYGGGGGMGAVALPPAAFSLSMPANGAMTANVTPTLQWTASLYVTTYTVEVSTTNTFTAGTTVSSPSLPAGTTTWTVTPALSAGTAYFWRVTAFNAYGMLKAGNGPFSFTTP